MYSRIAGTGSASADFGSHRRAAIRQPSDIVIQTFSTSAISSGLAESPEAAPCLNLGSLRGGAPSDLLIMEPSKCSGHARFGQPGWFVPNGLDRAGDTLFWSSLESASLKDDPLMGAEAQAPINAFILTVEMRREPYVSCA